MSAKEAAKLDRVADLKKETGEPTHACPFCPYQTMRSIDARKHARRGKPNARNVAYSAPGCTNYYEVAKLFKAKGLTIEPVEKFRVEVLVKKNKLLPESA